MPDADAAVRPPDGATPCQVAYALGVCQLCRWAAWIESNDGSGAAELALRACHDIEVSGPVARGGGRAANAAGVRLVAV